MAYGNKNISIGNLRFLVTLAVRAQSPDGNTGITESFVAQRLAYADIVPLGTQTYINGQQIDTPITHRIIIRWQDDVDNFDVVLRTLLRPDGTARQEIYRVRRTAELEGRQRFLIIDAELERREG